MSSQTKIQHFLMFLLVKHIHFTNS